MARDHLLQHYKSPECHIRVDLALFPVALDWSQREKLHKVSEIFLPH